MGAGYTCSELCTLAVYTPNLTLPIPYPMPGLTCRHAVQATVRVHMACHSPHQLWLLHVRERVVRVRAHARKPLKLLRWGGHRGEGCGRGPGR